MIKTMNDKNSNEYFVIDLDAKEVIRGVQWANDETGQYQKFAFDKDGDIIRKYCSITQQHETVLETKKGNILIVRANGIKE